MSKENQEAVSAEESARQKAVAKMKKVWVSQGWRKPEERLVVAEFGEFVWVIPTAAARQNDYDSQHIFTKDLIFETEFLAVSN